MTPDRPEVQTGNAGIGPGTWTGWDGPSERPPLPQYPQPADLPPAPPITAEIRREAMRDTAEMAGICALTFAAGVLLTSIAQAVLP